MRFYLIASTTQECPTSTSEKVVWTIVDSFHDGAPVQVDRTLCEWYVDRATSGQFRALVADIKDALQPVFNIIELHGWYGIDVKRYFCEILENQD
jgi:hypothetical protein